MNTSQILEGGVFKSHFQEGTCVILHAKKEADVPLAAVYQQPSYLPEHYSCDGIGNHSHRDHTLGICNNTFFSPALFENSGLLAN